MRRLEAEALPSCLDAVHALLAELWADAPDVGEGDRARLTIAVAELVGNVVEHGRTAGGGAPRLALEVDAEDARLLAVLEDDGVGYPPRGDLPADELAESGRGLALVYAALDEVGYERRDGGNHWHLVLRRAA